jgi:natural product biosynthesis luciferase-like monooxygenase protein/FkbM family methyltransferase
VEVRAGSVVLPLHDSLRVAEEWSVVDNLSQGRAAISFASGWHADDFVFAPDAYADRHEVMYREIETVRKLWRGESVVRRNGAGHEVEIRISPRPVRPELPVWVTAAGNPQTFASAGRIGANLLTHLLGQSAEELEEKIAVYRAARREAGHEGEGRVTLMLHTFVGDSLEEVREQVREPFTNYLRSSVGLIRNLARSLGRDVDSEQFTEEDMQAVLEHAFNRYFEKSGLMGTTETCLRMVERLKAAGVDEVACLVDFGVPVNAVLESLGRLDELRQLSNVDVAETGEDYSIAAQLERHRVTHLQCTPSMAGMLASDAETLRAMGSLEALLVGGEAFPFALASQLREALPGRLINMYGPTETTIWSSTEEIFETRNPVPIGRPIANTQLRILDRALAPAPVGVPGELYIGGDGVTRGYLGRPALTAERFVPDFFSAEPGARLYRTGDRARYLADGRVEFLGRLDNQLKVRGYRIEAGEIESVLGQYPGVERAVVVAREAGLGEKQLVAYVVAPGRSADGAAPVPPEAERLLEGLERFRLPNGMLVAQRSGFRTNVTYREVFEDAIYLRHGVRLRDGDTVFDVGANIGMFSLFANSRARGLKLYAFEPIPPTFEALRANAAIHKLDARLFPFGVSDRAGSAAFTYYPQMSGLSGRYSDAERDKEITRAIVLDRVRAEGVNLNEQELDQLIEEQFRSETFDCQLVTLSDVIREEGVERIDLLKIDVEKSELDVLNGLNEEDWKKVRQIVIEVDTDDLLAGIKPLLARRGFDFEVDDFVSVEGDGNAPGVHVYMLYAARREEAGAETETDEAPGVVEFGAHAAAAPSAVGDLSTTSLRSFLRERLPDYMVPSQFVLLDSLPLTPNGKIDLRALPEPGGARPELTVEYVAPESESEVAIAEVWREVLKVERVGVHDNFFEVGGTSLLLVQVNNRLREVFNQRISVVEMFRHPTVSSLAKALGGEPAAGLDAGRVQGRASRQAEALGRQKNLMEQRRQARQRKTEPAAT